MPGIDNAFLAMDTEEGVEVVWNEVQFSEKKNFKAQQVKWMPILSSYLHLLFIEVNQISYTSPL